MSPLSKLGPVLSAPNIFLYHLCPYFKLTCVFLHYLDKKNGFLLFPPCPSVFPPGFFCTLKSHQVGSCCFYSLWCLLPVSTAPDKSNTAAIRPQYQRHAPAPTLSSVCWHLRQEGLGKFSRDSQMRMWRQEICGNTRWKDRGRCRKVAQPMGTWQGVGHGLGLFLHSCEAGLWLPVFFTAPLLLPSPSWLTPSRQSA